MTIKQKITVILVLLFLTAIGNVIFIFKVQEEAAEKRGWVEHTYIVINQAQDLMASLKDMETGQRGFLLTDNDKYLTPFNQGKAVAQKKYYDLKKLTADNPTQQVRLKELSKYMHLKTAELQQTIDFTRADKKDKALKLVNEDIGQQYMAKMRKIISAFIAEEKMLLFERNATYKKYNEYINLLIGVELFIFIILAVVTFLFVGRKLIKPLEIKTKELEKMAKTDALSGAYNRFYFKTYLDEIIKKSRREQGKITFCIMMIDFDDFKTINDYYGHEVGDEIIKQFCLRVREIIKKQDLLCRIGGDEFVIILEELNATHVPGKIAQHVIELSEQPYCIDNKLLYCQVSIGLACYPESGNDVTTLMRHVDLALYRAKQRGSQYAYFSRTLQEAFIYRQRLEQDIIRAFDNQEFYIVLQPKICAKTDNIIGAEALLRWHQPKRQQASLFEVINSVQSMGLSGKLNSYVVKQVLKELKNFPLTSNLIISINISPSVYHLEKNIADCVDMIKESQLSSHYQFYFEITETSLKDKHLNIKSGSKIDQLLKSSNIGLSLDDFGVEHSSINRLFECNFSIIKIDMSFVRKLETEESKAAIIVIKSVIDIARWLEMQVVAEGAETKYQVDILKKLGCGIIQGYFYYKPMAVESFFKVLK